MNKRAIVSVVVLFILAMIGGVTIHGTILAPEYQRLAERGVFRLPDAAEPLMPILIAAHLVLAVGLTWVYRMGRDARPWPGQGLRFGLAIATLVTIPTYLIYYVVTPLQSDFVAKQIALDAMMMVILGLAAAYINRDPAPARV